MKKDSLKSLLISAFSLMSITLVCAFSFTKFVNTYTTGDSNLGSSEIFLDEEAYSSIGFYFDMELNDRPCDITDDGNWDASHLLTSEQNVVKRYSSTTGQITTRSYPFFKLTESMCWMSLNDADVNDVFFINGTFRDVNGYYINIKPIFINVVDKNATGIKVACDTPKVTVSSSCCEISKKTIRAYETQGPNDLLFNVDKGSINISYSSDALSDQKFIRRANETVSNYFANANITYKNFSYTVQYNLLVGLHDFKMMYGASVSLDAANSCELRFTATLPSFSLTNFTLNDARFIVVNNEDLHGYKLNYENIFGSKRVFTFNESETDKYLLKRTRHISTRVDSNGTCTITGSVRGILPSNYLEQYVGLCYFENSNGNRALAYFENDDQFSNVRSPYQVAVLAYDNGNQSLYNKFISTTPSLPVDCFVRCFNADVNNTLIKTVSVSGNLFTEINAPAVSGMKASLLKHRLSGSGNYIDFFYSKDYGTDYDVYAWDVPLLDSTNNFDNEYTTAVAQTMKNAGITVAITSGHSYRTIYNDSDISYFKYMIQAYYKNGIKTAIQIGGSVDSDRHFYESAPDFSMCPGFYGYLEWDEPSISKLPTHLSNYAKEFNKVYRGTNHKFIVNLNPSHASTSIVSTVFTDYIQSYCTNVLQNLDVEHRYLSIDNYPFSKSTSSLQENTILDMAYATLYGHEYQATTSFCLQSSGWDDTLGDDDSHMRAPYASEMKMLVYDALCFGFDTISWFTYSANIGHYQDYETNGGQRITAVNKDNSINSDIYTGLQSANACWKEGKTLLKDYSYKGTYTYSHSSWLSEAKPFNKILNDSTWCMDRGYRYYISDITSLPNTLFSSTSSTKSYLIGVYENSLGEQAYVINNYVSYSKGSTSVKIKMNSDVVVTQNGASQKLSSGTTKEFTINQGSGLIVRKA